MDQLLCRSDQALGKKSRLKVKDANFFQNLKYDIYTQITGLY